MKGRHYVAIAEKVKTRREKHKWTLCAIFCLRKLGLPPIWVPVCAGSLAGSDLAQISRDCRPPAPAKKPAGWRRPHFPRPISSAAARAAPAGGAALRAELQPRLTARDLGVRDL